MVNFYLDTIFQILPLKEDFFPKKDRRLEADIFLRKITISAKLSCVLNCGLVSKYLSKQPRRYKSKLIEERNKEHLSDAETTIGSLYTSPNRVVMLAIS